MSRKKLAELFTPLLDGETDAVDIGERVFCDWCDAEWTNRKESGGFLLISKAICPDCAPKVMADLIRNGELQYVRADCPEGLSFRDWCLRLRGGNNEVRITKGSL